ncbi:MAG: GC-type dockerin domain-anchored protein [Phycisphaerales bacterium]
MNRSITLLTLAALSTAATSAAAQSYTTTFDDGLDGWEGSNGSFLTTNTSNGNRHIRSVDETFGVWYRNTGNAEFLGDYTQSDSVTLSMDIRVDLLNSQNLPDTIVPYTRPLVVELRNYRYAGGFHQYGSVYFVLSREINETNQDDWTTFSITFDPSSTDLPEGWGGFGGDNDQDGPVLPEGATFADIVSNVDEIVFSTYDPEEFYLFAFFDVSVDNFSITRDAGCTADFNDDGVLDFFDVSLFINAFGAQDPAADLNQDRAYDFFDVSTFLSAYNAGCP